MGLARLASPTGFEPVSSDRKSDVYTRLCYCNLLFYSELYEIMILEIIASDQIVTGKNSLIITRITGFSAAP